MSSVVKVTNGNLKRIHVNKHVMARNRKEADDEPAIGIEMSGAKKRYGHLIEIHGPSKVIHDQDNPLSCGARCWVETRAAVTIVQVG